jgi:hypothetical protein
MPGEEDLTLQSAHIRRKQLPDRSLVRARVDVRDWCARLRCAIDVRSNLFTQNQAVNVR